MTIGILKERFEDEQRVSLSPFGVESLVRAGARVVIETNAGREARFPDDQYEQAGANILYSASEVIGRSDVVMKVMPPAKEEYEQLQEGQTLFCYMNLGVTKKAFVQHLISHRVTAVAYELLRGRDGGFPILSVMSEISGQVAALIGARYMRSDQGGRGVLLGGVAGVAPAAVVILGAGNAGFAAAQACMGLGAQVIMLDNDIDRLRAADLYFNKRITTVIASPENIRRGVTIADVFIGAISITSEEGHQIISEEMVKTMKPGAVIIDISINQGGCVATSRPTTINDPIFVKHGVVHYCVPNMPSMVARSSTYALTNSLLPYVTAMLAQPNNPITDIERLRCGVITHAGQARHDVLQALYDLPVDPILC